MCIYWQPSLGDCIPPLLPLPSCPSPPASPAPPLLPLPQLSQLQVVVAHERVQWQGQLAHAETAARQTREEMEEKVCACVHVCVRACVCACVHVCAWSNSS